jgi:hypothetical protein
MRFTTILPSRAKTCFGFTPGGFLLTFAFTGLLLPAHLCVAQERCGLAKDFMVQALEHIKTGAPNEIEDGLQLLKHANEQCTSFGDAWYYRSLFERKLNQVAKANYSLSKAKMFGSEAMEQGLDPFTLASAESTANVPLGAVREKWALVIGISKFTDKRVPRLNYPGKDAQDLAALLKDPQVGRFKPENVHVVLDSLATTRQIKADLNWLARSAKPDDLVVIFISTHGSPRELDTREVNYIVTSDTEIKPQDSLFATALAMVELTEVVRSRILARRTAILLDTCHSGAATATGLRLVTAGVAESAVSQTTLDSIRQGVGRAIITSSQVGESSYENDDAQNGYFTYYLMKALRQSKGLDPIDKVYSSVRDGVSKSVQAKYKLPQHPVLSLSESKIDIILGAAPSSGGS